MASAAGASFVHRRNRDGSIDSICTQCFATVATCEFEAELLQAERFHACDPQRLEYFAPKRPKE